MPAVPSFIIDPVWEQFAALLPAQDVTHPKGGHRPRVPDRAVFDKLVQVLVFGCAYHLIADATVSATTLRRRRDEWITTGVMQTLEQLARDAYDRIVGLRLDHVSVDGCITKAPCGGELAGPLMARTKVYGTSSLEALSEGLEPVRMSRLRTDQFLDLAGLVFRDRLMEGMALCGNWSTA